MPAGSDPSAWRYVRYGAVGAACLAGLLIPVAIWVGITGVMAANHVQTAKADIAQAQAAVEAGDTAKAVALVPVITDSTARANSLVSGPLWWITEHLPIAGPPATAVADTIGAVDLAARGALGPLAVASGAIDSGALRDPSGRINVEAIQAMQRPIATAAAAVGQASGIAHSVSGQGVPEAIMDQNEKAADELAALNNQLQVLAQATEILPEMLGSEKPQSYFVGFTSPAEARGTGGFLGTFAIITVDNGMISIEKVESNSALKDFTKPVADFGPDYTHAWGNNPQLWSGMNLSPNFPYAAQQWMTGWERQTGQKLQGAMQVDPATLSYLVAATGPVTMPDGSKLTADQVVPYLTNGVYKAFGPERNVERKQFQVAVAQQALTGLTGAGSSVPGVLKAFSRAVSERRLLVYSADPHIEKALEPWPISGVVDNVRGPYAMLVVNNYAGNKADYYLDRTLTYSVTQCAQDRSSSTISATLTNTMPMKSNLPAVITGRSDRFSQGAVKGSTLVNAEILLPIGAEVESAELNGSPTSFSPEVENGRPAVSKVINLDPGDPVTLTLKITEPASAREPVIPVQPLVRPQVTDVTQSVC